jgi:hypothetical protein
VRPLLTPHVDWMAVVGFIVGWLVVAQVVFGLVRKQRAMDVFLIVIATVLVGRVFVAGSTLDIDEIAAIALLLPLLVPISRLDDGARSTLFAVLLGVWLAWAAVRPLLQGATALVVDAPALREMLLRSVPPPPLLANKAFSYLSLGWLLTGAGLVPHVAAGMVGLFVLLLTMLQLGMPAPAYGWVDLLLAGVTGWVVARWMPQR